MSAPTAGELHISAISMHAYAAVVDKYALLSCGASMGDGYGPILIAPATTDLPEAEELRPGCGNEPFRFPVE
jgi:predicted solute-binding protein